MERVGRLPRAARGARRATRPARRSSSRPSRATTLGYGELLARVDALAADSTASARRPARASRSCCPTGSTAATLFLGTMAAGRVVVPVNLLAQDAHLDHTLAHAEPRVVFASGEHAPRVRASLARIGASPALEVEVDPDRLALPPRARAAIAGRRPGSRPAMLMYTSGTTGLPKGVLLSHANMLHAGRAVASHHALSAGRSRARRRCRSTTSTASASRRSARSCAGGSIVMPHRFSVSQWWSLVARYRPTWLNLVPTIVAYLLNAPDPTPDEREAMRGVRFARSASAPLPPEQQRAFEAALRHPDHRGDGAHRMRVGRVLQSDATRERRIGSPGRPLAVEARVVDRDGRALADGERGEIQLRGPNVMRGYYRAPERDGGDAVGRRLARAPATSATATPTASTSSPGARRS